MSFITLPVKESWEVTQENQVLKQHPIAGREEPKPWLYEMVKTTNYEAVGIFSAHIKKMMRLQNLIHARSNYIEVIESKILEVLISVIKLNRLSSWKFVNWYSLSEMMNFWKSWTKIYINFFFLFFWLVHSIFSEI